jgi:hypothetical protein
MSGQHDKGVDREAAEALFTAGRVSATEVAKLVYGDRWIQATRARRSGIRANVKNWRTSFYRERGLEVPTLDFRGRTALSVPRPLPAKDHIEKNRGSSSETQFPALYPASTMAQSAPTDLPVSQMSGPSQPDALDTLLATLPIKLPLVVSDEAPLEERQRAFALRASVRRMSRKDAFAAAGVKAEVADEWLADLSPRASGLSFVEEIEMARAIGALEHVEALARYAAQNPFSPKGLDIRTWLLERQHQDFIRKQAQAIIVGGEVFVRTPESTAPARLAQDIEAIAKRLTFHLPALPASEQIIDAVVSEVEQEREEDADGDE